MNKAPAFQFYANDWLSSTKITLMTPAQEGAYIRLLCIAWNDPNCSIPAADEDLAILTRMGEEWFKGGSTRVKECFEPHPNLPGRLVNQRLLEERQKQEEWREKSRQGGLKSGEARRQKETGAENKEDAPPLAKKKGGSRVVQPKGNSSSSSSTSVISDTNVSGDKSPPPQSSPPDPPAQPKAISPIWQIGLQLLTGSGDSDAQARSFLGGLCKQYGNDAVAQAVASAAAAVPVDPKAYLTKILQQGGKSNGSSTRTYQAGNAATSQPGAGAEAVRNFGRNARRIGGEGADS